MKITERETDRIKERTLVLVRGLPGSGKTTFAENINGKVKTYSADDYFYSSSGEYIFNPAKLPDAHKNCQERVRSSFQWYENFSGRWSSYHKVAVANTFSSRWEMEPYLRLAQEFGYRVFVIDLFDGGLTDEELKERNSHGVPLETIQNMRQRWEHDWKAGSTLPPWERR